METVEVLRKAIEEKQSLKITYQGGSFPGQVREIHPLTIENDRLRARCKHTQKAKVFIINKIRIASSSDGPVWGTPVEQKYDSLNDFLTEHGENFKNIGWHIEVDFHEKRGIITLHKVRKNGIPLKKSEIGIGCIPEYFLKTTYEIKTNSYVVKKCKVRKPWYVCKEHFEILDRFSTLDEAVEYFLTRLERLDPKFTQSKRKQKD